MDGFFTSLWLEFWSRSNFGMSDCSFLYILVHTHYTHKHTYKQLATQTRHSTHTHTQTSTHNNYTHRIHTHTQNSHRNYTQTLTTTLAPVYLQLYLRIRAYPYTPYSHIIIQTKVYVHTIHTHTKFKFRIYILCYIEWLTSVNVLLLQTIPSQKLTLWLQAIGCHEMFSYRVSVSVCFNKF